MPYINIKTNKKVSVEEEALLRQKFGEAISIFPGKSESWLMFLLEDGCKMAFKGKTESSMAFVEIKLYGEVNPAASRKMTGRACEILKDVLAISPDQVYVRYEATENWGWNGDNF